MVAAMISSRRLSGLRSGRRLTDFVMALLAPLLLARFSTRSPYYRLSTAIATYFVRARADPHHWCQPARRLPVPGRALRRQDPTVCGCRENDGGGLVNRWNRAGISLFCGDQSNTYNQPLAPAALTEPRKYGLPLPYVISRKTRGPRQVRHYLVKLPSN